jgi:hypothetical protein
MEFERRMTLRKQQGYETVGLGRGVGCLILHVLRNIASLEDTLRVLGATKAWQMGVAMQLNREGSRSGAEPA